MKIIRPFTLALLLLTVSCHDEEPALTGKGSKADLREWTGTSLISVMEDLGFVIHEGAQPPNVEGWYTVYHRVLEATNVPFDSFDEVYSIDYELTEQNSSTLRFDFNTVYFDTSGNFIASYSVTTPEVNTYLMGNGNNFSAFIKRETTSGIHDAIVLEAISGQVADSTIYQFQNAIFMLDDQGSPEGTFIEEGQGRIFRSARDVIRRPL